MPLQLIWLPLVTLHDPHFTVFRQNPTDIYPGMTSPNVSGTYIKWSYISSLHGYSIFGCLNFFGDSSRHQKTYISTLKAPPAEITMNGDDVRDWETTGHLDWCLGERGVSQFSSWQSFPAWCEVSRYLFLPRILRQIVLKTRLVRSLFHWLDNLSCLNILQGGLLPVIDGVITPINGLKKG